MLVMPASGRTSRTHVLSRSSEVMLSSRASGLTYSESYIANATSQPRSRSPQYTLIDASVRVAQSDDKWEIALIGRNLTNKFYWTRSTDNPASSANPTKLADTIGVPSRGREVMIRVGFKY